MLQHSDGQEPQGRDLVEEAMEASQAPGTRAVYASHLKHWQGWCATNNVPDLQATPEDLNKYLAQRAERHVISTVRDGRRGHQLLPRRGRV